MLDISSLYNTTPIITANTAENIENRTAPFPNPAPFLRDINQNVFANK